MGCIFSAWTFYERIITQAFIPPVLIAFVFGLYKYHGGGVWEVRHRVQDKQRARQIHRSLVYLL
jgi:hypothetical protein